MLLKYLARIHYLCPDSSYVPHQNGLVLSQIGFGVAPRTFRHALQPALEQRADLNPV